MASWTAAHPQGAHAHARTHTRAENYLSRERLPSSPLPHHHDELSPWLQHSAFFPARLRRPSPVSAPSTFSITMSRPAKPCYRSPPAMAANITSFFEKPPRLKESAPIHHLFDGVSPTSIDTNEPVPSRIICIPSAASSCLSTFVRPSVGRGRITNPMTLNFLRCKVSSPTVTTRLM